MKKKSSGKTTAIVVIVIIVGAVVYFYYQGSSPSSSGSLLQSSGTAAASVGSSELTLLGRIQSLKIDPSLFSDQAYRSLQDYSVVIPTENVGRPDPFAPIPGVATPGSVPSAPGH